MKKLMFLLPILILISSCVAGEGYKQHVEIPDNRNAINIARNIELTKALDDLAKRENGRWVLQLRTDRVRSSVQGQLNRATIVWKLGYDERLGAVEQLAKKNSDRISALEVWKTRGTQMTEEGIKVRATLRIAGGSERTGIIWEFWSYPKGNTPAKLSGYQVEKLNGTMQDITVADATKVLKEAEATGSFRTARAYLDTWRRTL